MNAKIGKEIQAFRGSIGSHSLHHESNDNGIRLATFALQNNLMVGGTFFPHKDVHKGTWISPDGQTINQIDHIMIRRKFRSALFDTRVYRDADCDTDHMLVVGKIRIKLKSRSTITDRREKLNIDKLENPEIKNAYALNLQNRFEILEQEEIGMGCGEIASTVIGGASEVLGTTRGTRGNDWFDQECGTAAGKRRECRRRWLNDRRSERRREKMGTARNEATTLNRRKKREAVQRELRDIEECRLRGKVRRQFQGIKKIRNGYQPRNEVIRSKEGDLIVNKEGIQERWMEHFEELFNRPPPQNPVEDLEIEFNGEDLEPLSREDVLAAIKNLKNHKAAGMDNISAELIKYGGPTLHKRW